MVDKTMYAVVDIETTGTNPKTDKVIQFACVFIQNHKVVNHFSTEINPLRSIPPHIETLTGLSNKDVATSPLFEDVAYTIRQMIDGCIFVAHNVFFDFSFLNSELERSGVAALDVPCIDTVELAQIAYPTSHGFRVTDLAEMLGVTHENPHEALSDALVTAEIFLSIEEKLQSLPLQTLEQLVTLSTELGVSNHEWLESLYKKQLSNAIPRLKDGWKSMHGIVLKEKDESFFDTPSQFKKESLSLADFKGENQQVMAQLVATFIQQAKDDCKQLMIEAETGSGKTLGYLYPFTQQSQREPVVVSTSSLMLQEQLIKKDIPLLSQLIDYPLRSILLKSSSHYIDLARFYMTLQEPIRQKHYRLYQMATLVWLLETESGDLDEMNLNKQHLFFQHIAHTGRYGLRNGPDFGEEDFWEHVLSKKKYADFMVTNHAFLLEETFRSKPLLPDKSYLVIDEAHRLPSLLEEKGTLRISFRTVYRLLRQVQDREDLTDFLTKEMEYPELTEALELLNTMCGELRQNLEWLEDYVLQSIPFSEGHPDQLMTNQFFEELPKMMKKNIQQCRVLFRELGHVSELVLLQIGREVPFVIEDYLRVLQELLTEKEKWLIFFGKHNVHQVRWAQLFRQNISFVQFDMKDGAVEETNWFKRSKKVIYTSGTLQLDINSSFFETRLGLSNVEKYRLPSIYNYQEQAKLFVVKNKEVLSYRSTKEMARYIGKQLEQLYEQRSTNMLVLFTSHELLRHVYEYLAQQYGGKKTEILGQGISGTKEKMMKRFQQSETAILLGASSYWEGADFLGKKIDLVVMTKLPFDPPTRPIVKARYDYIQSLGKKPFIEDALPQAGIRLRQGVGRLIRSESDKGVIVLLDHRLVTASYASILQSYLPEDLGCEYLSINDISDEITLFFN